MAVKAVPDVDLLDPSLYRKGIPHELYAELREVGPVLWHPRTHVPAYGSDIEFWAVLGHPEVDLFPSWIRVATKLSGKSKAGARKARILRYAF